MRVVVADDALLLREGVARLLIEAGFDVVGQSGTAADLLRDVHAHAPDVAIVDIRMPPTHTDEGLRAAREIRASYPDVGIVILSQHADVGVAMELLADSAVGVGYMLKESVGDLEEFADAVRRVAKGGSALDPAIVSQLLGAQRGDDPVAAFTRPRARGAAADGGGPVEPRHRLPPGRERARDPAARGEHLREARAAGDR